MGIFKNSTFMAVVCTVLALLTITGVVLGGIAIGTKSSQNDVDGSIASVREQIDSIKASIPALEATGTELGAYIDTLEATAAELQTKLDATNASIMTNLETRVNEKIATDIKAAVDALRTELGADYAAKIEAATNAVTSAYTAAIATAKGDIEAAYTKAIADAIAASESAMKEWVNFELQKVYSDISALRIELEALTASAATDEELAAAVTAQQAALDLAKTDLTAAYEKAINDAITNNNGKINAEISAAVKTAQDNLQAQIDAIRNQIDTLSDRVTTLENSFAGRIQSLIYVPDYTDGKVLMDYETRTTRVHFRISPASIAKLISVKQVEAFVIYTDDPTNRDGGGRSIAPEFPLTVVSVTGQENGMLELILKEDSENLFDTDYWSGAKEAVLYIRIDDGNSDVVSDLVPMIAHAYGSIEGIRIYDFGDGNTYTGEVTE